MQTRVLWRAALIFACVSSASAQTADTGAIIGYVLEGTVPLESVTVTLESAALPSIRSQVTDSHGSFRFPLLPPGQYAVSASLTGFDTTIRKNISVNLAKTALIQIVLHPVAYEQINVSAIEPITDMTSTLTGVSVDSETIGALPLDRNYLAGAQLAPGTNRDDIGTRFYDATSLENEYIVNGLNVTDIYRGQEVATIVPGAKNVSVEFVQEIDVLSGGLPAEYGRITGGIIDAVTKSGSNDFHGASFGYTTGDSLRSRSKHSPAGVWLTDLNRQSDYGASLGGFFVKDRIWFFAAYDRFAERDLFTRLTSLSVPGFSLAAGASIPEHRTSNFAAAKITFAPAANHLLDVSLFEDPSVFGGVIGGVSGPPDTFLGFNKQGGSDFVGRYYGVLRPSWYVDALAGRDSQSFRTTGSATQIPLFVDLSQIPAVVTGGTGQFTNHQGRRSVLKFDSSVMVSGQHTFKLGAEFDKPQALDSAFVSGGDRVVKRCSAPFINNQCPGSSVYYLHLAHLNDRSPTFRIDDPSTWAENIINPLPINYVAHNISTYAEDEWRVIPNVTVNGGLRVERQVLDNGNGQSTLRIDNLSPRLGIVWDVHNEGHRKLYAYFGRLFESLSLDLEQSFGANGVTVVSANFDPAAGHITPDPRAPGNQTSSIVGTAGEPAARNLKGQFIDEYLLGYDRDFGSLSAGAKAMFRNLGRVIEDTCPDSGCIIVNPGRGPGATIQMNSGETVPTPKPVRRYAALELHATKRLSGNIEFFASYLWSRLYGNYDGLFSLGQNDPNTDAAFDSGDTMINSYGPLSADRTHQVKFHGAWHVQSGPARGATIGVATHWYSGTPVTAMGRPYFLTSRGDLGRGPSDYEADIHLGYPLATLNRHVQVIGDVFNVLNRQAPASLDLDFNAFHGAPCAGIPADICSNGAIRNKPGTTLPVGEIPDPRATAPNPHFLQPLTYTGRRSIRVGARLQF